MKNVRVAAAFVMAAAALALAQERSKLDPITDESGFAWIDGDDSIPHAVERSEVKKGIPKKGHPRDLIPPIDEPRFFDTEIEAVEQLALADDDRVLCVVVDGDARAYLTRILDRHEVVNDTVGGVPIAILW